MIPLAIPPLTGLSVLVTRPQAQARELCRRIESHGGEAIAFPVIQIEPLAVSAITARYDVTIFTSSNAAQHGVPQLEREYFGQVAAIGSATAQALGRVDVTAQIVPTAANSEGLLAHPQIAALSDVRVLIVRGRGGRELLRQTLLARGCQVDIVEVYSRNQATPDARDVATLEDRWAEEGIGAVTVTSSEILEHLHGLLSVRGRTLLRATPIVVASERICSTALALGLHGECLVAPSADDDALVGALSHWCTRARV